MWFEKKEKDYCKACFSVLGEGKSGNNLLGAWFCHECLTKAIMAHAPKRHDGVDIYKGKIIK